MGIAAILAQNSQAIINLVTANVSTVPLTNSNVTLSEAEAAYPILEFTGTLTANVTVTIPANGKWAVYNATTGAYTVTLSSGLGATALAAQNVLSDVVALGNTGVLLSSGGSGSGGVSSFNTRIGAVTLEGSDITGAGGALLLSPAFSGTPTSTTPTAGDDSKNIATTAFVVTSLEQYAPLASPALTGTPTSPTPGNTSNSTNIATTAFVQNLISAVAGGLNYQGAWNASTNTPTLTSGVGTKGYLYQVDVAGTTTLDGNSTWDVGDLLSFSGTVWQRIPAQTSGVTSFNTRTGAITLESSDVTTALGFTPTSIVGLAPLESPAFAGTPTAPTPSAGNSSADIATTSFVATSFAPLASPALSGTPTAPTAATGTNTTQLATTAFVENAVSSVAGGFAPLASPEFTGTPTAPTPAVGSSSTDIATTSFVATSFAPIASPVLTGTPVAPTALAGTNTGQIATTAFVETAVSAVTGDFAPLASPSFTGRVQSPSYSYTVEPLGSVSGTQTLNLSAASEFTMTITGATTLAFTNTLGANLSQIVVIRFTNAGVGNIAWPASTKFAAKTPPVFTVSGTDVLGVMYDTTTSTYMVFVIGLNVG
jgi:hypothetical protein